MDDPVTLAVQPGLAPAVSLGADAGALAAAASTLRVYTFAGDVLSLGRYHVLPSGGDETRVRLHRRHTGGRAVAFGDGFVGIALTLPHRSALVAAEPLALAPEQVMNRCVRGILTGLKTAGVAPFYPGRDFITVNRRPIGVVTFEVVASGALLFEAILATERDFGLTAALLDAVDPAGLVPAEMLTADTMTSLAHLGTRLSLDDVATLVRRGYEEAFGIRFEAAALPMAAPMDEDRWLRQRALRPELAHRATTRTQLGALEAHVAVEDDTIADVMLAGDFIANSPAIAALEDALRRGRAERPPIEDAVRRVFGQPANFILGVGPVDTVAETIVRALAA